MLERKVKQDFIIMRYSCEEYAKDLYENGTVYLKTIQYFKNLEDVQGKQYLRGDRNEGVKKISNYDNKKSKPWLSVKIPGKEPIVLYPEILTLREYHDKLPLNVYCMSAFDNTAKDSDGNIKIDLQALHFGNHFVVFKNSQDFYDRLNAELKRLKYNFWFGHVQYYDATIDQNDLTHFDKPNEFSWQNEFRLIVKHPKGLNEDLVIKLGSMEDIADLVVIEDEKKNN